MIETPFFKIFILFICMVSSNLKSQTIETVPFVDLKKYEGTWYEIAAFPLSFEKGCHCTTAEYTMTDKGYVIVENRCNKDSINGIRSYIQGKAFVQENSGNAKLKVQFFWPFKGSYWVIDLADDYSFAVVGNPTKKYLWILSRTSKIPEVTYNEIIERLKIKGFDVAKLQLTPQKY